eukprot:scaffold244334_cov17-Tisochrysis_lutea.AAC.1
MDVPGCVADEQKETRKVRVSILGACYLAMILTLRRPCLYFAFVPVEVTIGLLKAAMEKYREGMKMVLIDGFPRYRGVNHGIDA